VVLCPSGISDITRRTKINNLLVANEGTYLKNLERPVRVTHLLCSGDEETEKMRYAEKFNSRCEAKIHLVWEEWFWDSLDFGGRFEEEKYDVRTHTHILWFTFQSQTRYEFLVHPQWMFSDSITFVVIHFTLLSFYILLIHRLRLPKLSLKDHRQH
jgi:hypothetical protein